MENSNKYGAAVSRLHALIFILVLACPGLAAAQSGGDSDDAQEDAVDEITVTGSQIKGARIADALAVSVVTAEDIELHGVESGDELLDRIPEMGQNFFSEMDTAGGVNSARGDVGAINMRNLGTGNTLALLNGRRLVNMPMYQTEEVGGSFVPVNSVNSEHIPVFGVERIEILRDGASAIYGADAVAGVINTVLKDDFEGFTIRVRADEYDQIPRGDRSLGIEWGDSFNGGRTHVGVFARHYRRDAVNASDDWRWADSDFTRRFGEGTTYNTSTQFRNDSANSLYGQFDVVPTLSASNSLRVNGVTDSAGEFEVYPIGDPRCAGGFDMGNGSCIHADGQGTYRYNLNEVRQLISDLERTTLFGYANHELDSGLEVFGDFYYYRADTVREFDPSTPLTAVPLRVGAANPYNPFGPVGSVGRLPDSIIGTSVPAGGYELAIDNYRFLESPRKTDNNGDAIRFLAGLRGAIGDWDWESAAVWSEATQDDITHNRVSNTLITEALFDPTEAAYNPFAGGVDSNIERAQIDVYRKGRSSLTMWDLKFSNAEIFEMPAGPVGFLAGVELRRETYEDDRDPRLDGTITFTDFQGETYPLVSDVVGSSPTPDGKGSRNTTSLFAEFQVPLHRTLDLQIAGRYEDFDDIGDTTVGKVAFGWRPVQQILFRGSWSEAFRAPNLITINEEFVARSNTLNDWVCFYGQDQGTLPGTTDCDYSIQRQATGSRALVPEESTNTSVGMVWQPNEQFTFTIDWWSIEKDQTVGLFGEENHILYDLVLRTQAGTADCSDEASLGNPLVVREPHDPADTDLVDGFLAAGICPVGRALYVTDNYTNLDTRTLKGYDIGVYYDVETGIGNFDFSYNGSFYTKFEQTASSELSLTVIEGKENDPTITYPLIGLGDLLGINGNQRHRHSASLAWRKGDWAAGVTAFHISSFDQILSSGDPFKIDAMSTVNMKFDYRFDVADVDTRVRLGVNNAADRRAPIADESFGFAKDAHRDWGRYYYVDVRLSF